MKSLIKLIRRQDPRILLMIALLFIFVTYAVYRAVDSLAGGDPSPDYRRSPPAAFAIPRVDTIVDENLLDNPRVPDSTYKYIQETSDKVSNGFLKGTLGPDDLIALGMGSDTASGATDQVYSYQYFRGKNPELSPEFQVGNVTTGEGGAASITVTREIDYSSGTATDSVYLNLGYAFDVKTQKWELISLEASS